MAFTFIPGNDASTAGYDPTTPGDWSPAPEDVLTALDQLAATLAAIPGPYQYKGVWNATTNVPALVSSTGTQGDVYFVSVAGATNLDGITDWQVGDYAAFNGTVWQKWDNTDLVTSVNTKTGAVVLVSADIADSATKAASATDNAITRYDGVTGKLLKDSLKSIITDAGLVTFDTTSRIANTPILLVKNDGADLFTVVSATGVGAAGQIKGDATETSALFSIDAFDNTGKATLNIGLTGTGAISIVEDIAGALAKIENTLAGPFVIGNDAGLLRLQTLADMQFDLPSNDGSDKVVVRDSDDAEVAEIDSDGNVTAVGDLSGNNLSGTNTGDEVAASEGTAGVAELATQAETNTGTDDARIVTPLKLRNAPEYRNITVVTTTPYTALATDDTIIMNVAGASVDDLPQASTIPGKVYRIKRYSAAGANTVTITPFGGDTIDNGATKTLTSVNSSATLQSDGGTNWVII